MPVLGTRGLGGGRLGRGFAARGLRDAGVAPADVDAFVGRLDGERGRATERLYRSFFWRELPALAARALLRLGPERAQHADVRHG